MGYAAFVAQNSTAFIVTMYQVYIKLAIYYFHCPIEIIMYLSAPKYQFNSFL